MTDLEFWTKVDRAPGFGPRGACWKWSGANSEGYGVLRWQGNRERAHRVAYFLWFGEWPGTAVVRHDCDNTICVRPTHLRLGTQLDNIADRHSRGRDAKSRGERNGRCVLADATCRRISKLYASEMFSWNDLAEMFGVSKRQIGNIVSGKRSVQD